ncbi:putative DNA-binding pseudobarrel domain superfamily [Helianthus debilis subsp. tardiflorus]
MDPKNNAPSFLKLIDDYDPIFLEISYDFASLLWGGKVPYGQCLELIDDNLSWVVRLKRNVSGPVLGDGFTKFVKDSGLKRMIIYWSRLLEHRHFMFLYLNHAFSRTPSSLRLLLMIPLFSWQTNSGKIFTGKGLKVERQLCMLEIGIGMLRWRDGPT